MYPSHSRRVTWPRWCEGFWRTRAANARHPTARLVEEQKKNLSVGETFSNIWRLKKVNRAPAGAPTCSTTSRRQETSGLLPQRCLGGPRPVGNTPAAADRETLRR